MEAIPDLSHPVGLDGTGRPRIGLDSAGFNLYGFESGFQVLGYILFHRDATFADWTFADPNEGENNKI